MSARRVVYGVRPWMPAIGMVCTVLAVASSSAQDAPPTAWGRAHDVGSTTSSVRVAWLGAWSPLRPIADLARGEVRAPLGLGLLDAPAPMAGAFVLTGAPGSLARDLRPRLAGDTARFNELRVQRAAESGAFHRPLDLVTGVATQLSGGGWSPVGSRGVAMGRFAIDNEFTDTSSYSERISAGWSSPFVPTDSVRPPLQRTRARLEGALGLRLGQFGVGLSGGLDSREHNSVDFPLRRSGRWATPAAAIGVERVLPWHVRVGAFYRWSEPTETHVLSPAPLPTVIYPLQGYDEAPGILVAGSPYYVRVLRRATAVGGTIEAKLLGTTMVLTHERAQRAEDQFVQFTIAVRPTDAWRSTGSETRLQLARVFDRGLRVMVVAHDVRFDSEARRSDLKGLAVLGNDGQQAIEVDVRQRWSQWTAGVTAGGVRRDFVRRDYVALLAPSLTVQNPFASAEVARRVGQTSVALGVAYSMRAPIGSVPVPTKLGPNYRRLLAPELAYDAAESSAMALSLTGQRVIGRSTVFAQLRREQATATTVVEQRLQPAGARDRWLVTVGIR